MNSLRSAWRQLFRAPGFTAIAVLSLALGIGANAVMFSWIEAILLRPLPGIRHGEEIVALLSKHGALIGHTVSPPDLADFNAMTDVFTGVIGSQVTPACLMLEQEPQWVYGQIATANFFDVLGVQALPGLGRTFLPEEGDKPGGNPVLVLSEVCWREYFAADPEVISRTINLNTAGGDPRALTATVRREVQALDPSVALWTTLPLTEYVEAAYLVNNIATTMLSALGVLALVLAAMGIYGVMAYTGGQRVPEIGVRMALGARPADVARMVIGDGLRVLGLGLLIGLGGASAAGVGLAHFLPGVSAVDVTTIAVVAALLTAVTVLACWVPARRAAKVDPLVALRAE